MKVLIPIEISYRELLYKTYLSNLLAIEGFECYLGTKRNISVLINKFKNFIYLDKGYHAGVSDLIYKNIKSRNGVILNLDEEGAVDYPDSSTLKSRYSKQLFEASEKVMLWGNHQANLLKDLNISSENIQITGHPRFELLKKEYHHLYQEEVNGIMNRFGNFILINSNFGFGNNIKGDKFVIKDYGSRIKRIEEIVAFDKVKRETYVNLVKELAKDSQNNIVYRPHPEEEQSFYQKAFKGLKNVFIVFEGSVVPWLIAADIMIHPDCTTGVEALMVGKKSISYLPKNFNSEIVTQLPLDISFRFYKIDEVIQFIKTKGFKKNHNYNNDFEIIDNYFSYTTQSSNKVVECFIQAKKNFSTECSIDLSLKDILLLKAKDYKLKWSNTEKIKLSKNKLSGFENRNLNLLKSKLVKVNPGIDKVKIKSISNQLFKITI